MTQDGFSSNCSSEAAIVRTEGFAWISLNPLSGSVDAPCSYSIAQDVWILMSGSIVGQIEMYVFMAFYFSLLWTSINGWKNWKENLKFGFGRNIFTPFQNFVLASKQVKPTLEAYVYQEVFEQTELYLAILLFILALFAMMNRLLYGFIPTCGFNILPEFIWNGTSAIWGDANEWWILAGANSGWLYFGAILTFLIDWIYRIFVVRFAWKSFKKIRKEYKSRTYLGENNKEGRFSKLKSCFP